MRNRDSWFNLILKYELYVRKIYVSQLGSEDLVCGVVFNNR